MRAVPIRAPARLARSPPRLSVSTVPATLRRTFSSLRVRNYRLYISGQIVSLSGTWMQRIAQAWLVLKLTDSGTALGLVTALQFLPMLLLGPFGGVVADRIDKRRMLLTTQVAAGVLALLLGVLVVADVVQLWMVYVLAAALGLVNTIDTPTRQTFVLEMVGREQLPNAVSLNSVMVNLARIFGPAFAGVLITTLGLGLCFLLNAASYSAIIAALLLMRVDELQRTPPQPRRRGQLTEGFRYVRSTPALFVPLLMMAVIGTLAYEFQVVLPLLARFTFHGDAGTFSLMSSCMGGGAVLGGLFIATRHRTEPTALSWTAIVFGVVLLGGAVAPTIWIELVMMALIGAASIAFLALGNSTLQLATDSAMRGRVMALWGVAFLGSTPIGGPIIGWIGEHVGPRYAMGVGGVATVMAGTMAYGTMKRLAERTEESEAPPVAAMEAPAVNASVNAAVSATGSTPRIVAGRPDA